MRRADAALIKRAEARSSEPTRSQTDEPVDEKLNRSDIRSDPSDGSVQPGTPVSLTMVVVRADGSCAPVSGAIVDIWHANAAGKYSDISSEGTSGKKYLRGLQASDANGQAKFTTIFPGWYQGRAVHIHFKVRVFNGSSETYEFTSQLFFDPSTASAVYGTGVYASRGQATHRQHVGRHLRQRRLEARRRADAGWQRRLRRDVRRRAVGPAELAGTGSGTSTSGTATTNAVGAAVASTRFRRTKTGRRILRVTSRLTESADVSARLSRSGTTLVRKTASDLATGTRAMDLRIPLRTPGGKARLTVVYTDAAGLKKTIARTVTVPRKTLG